MNDKSKLIIKLFVLNRIILLDFKSNIVFVSSSSILTHIVSYFILDLFCYFRFITENNWITWNRQYLSMLLKIFNWLLLNLVTCRLSIKANHKYYDNNYCSSYSNSYKYRNLLRIYRYLFIRWYCWRIDQRKGSIWL